MLQTTRQASAKPPRAYKQSINQVAPLPAHRLLRFFLFLFFCCCYTPVGYTPICVRCVRRPAPQDPLHRRLPVLCNSALCNAISCTANPVSTPAFLCFSEATPLHPFSPPRHAAARLVARCHCPWCHVEHLYGSTRAALHLTLPALPIRVERRDRAARLVES